MHTESIWTVLITAITVLGSASAWRFYERRSDQKKDEDNETLLHIATSLNNYSLVKFLIISKRTLIIMFRIMVQSKLIK